jgi:probable F420-dependent oxidoreductase
MKIDRLGVWINTVGFPLAELTALAGRLEGRGYGMLWINDGMGGDPMVRAAHLLGATSKLEVALGVANIYSRDPTMMVGAQDNLGELSGGRFLLGVGVSHRFIVEGMRGHAYANPLATMRAYLQAMADIRASGPPPPAKPVTVIAALGPKMLEIAATMVDGAHPFMTTPGHTAMARGILGPDKLLLVEQKVMLERDPAVARQVGRALVAGAGAIPNYRNSILRMGFTTDDLENGGSDRLVDALLAWGDEAAIRNRIQEHWDAGADQVAIQVMSRGGGRLAPDEEALFDLFAPRPLAVAPAITR